MTENCGNCHFAFFHGVPTLDCRRRSPERSVRPFPAGAAEWPQVDGSQWCGDFKQAEDESGNVPDWMKR